MLRRFGHGSGTSWIGLAVVSLVCLSGAIRAETGFDVERKFTFSAEDLFGGLEAHRIVLTNDGLAVDSRSQTDPPSPAQITTDVIDLGGPATLSDPIKIKRARVAVLSNADDSDRIDVQLRSGSTYFQDAESWGEWSNDALEPPLDRYIQLRIRIRTQRSAFRVSSATVDCKYRVNESFQRKLTVASEHVPQIVKSTIPFGYQRPDHPDLAWLRETFRLERITERPSSEFEKVRALCTWVGSRKNDRRSDWNPQTFYPWHVRRVLDTKDGGTVYGHCASYCSVFIACCQSLGWQGRHLAVEGYKENCHEIAEIYINELGRWIYFDPSLATYYRDKKTGKPMDTVQMHDAYLATHFNQPGDSVPGREFDYDELARRRAAIDWQAFPGQPVSDDWVYGKKEAWNWTNGQGIMTTAWVQLTPRADFYDRPNPVFRAFGDGPSGEIGFPMWVDQRTPPRRESTHTFFTRRRDFYWTLNQASVRLVRVGEREVRVELGNSQPFFDHYRIVANGVTLCQSDRYFPWAIQSGTNEMTVHCVDAFGKQGAASHIILNDARR